MDSLNRERLRVLLNGLDGRRPDQFEAAALTGLCRVVAGETTALNERRWLNPPRLQSVPVPAPRPAA